MYILMYKRIDVHIILILMWLTGIGSLQIYNYIYVYKALHIHASIYNCIYTLPILMWLTEIVSL
jgi:hypothetical protein